MCKQLVAQLVDHSPSKQKAPGSSPSHAAQFFHPVTFGAQHGMPLLTSGVE